MKIRKEVTKIKKFLEVIHNIVPLLNTIEEGFNHIKKQLLELRYEEALGLLEDVVLGIFSIEDAIEPMILGLEENKIETFGIALKENINKTLAMYEDGKEAGLATQIVEEVLPAFQDWKEEIERVLRPYIVS